MRSQSLVCFWHTDFTVLIKHCMWPAPVQCVWRGAAGDGRTIHTYIQTNSRTHVPSMWGEPTVSVNCLYVHVRMYVTRSASPYTLYRGRTQCFISTSARHTVHTVELGSLTTVVFLFVGPLYVRSSHTLLHSAVYLQHVQVIHVHPKVLSVCSSMSTIAIHATCA